jgi:hypothetical protein
MHSALGTQQVAKVHETDEWLAFAADRNREGSHFTDDVVGQTRGFRCCLLRPRPLC